MVVLCAWQHCNNIYRPQKWGNNMRLWCNKHLIIVELFNKNNIICKSQIDVQALFDVQSSNACLISTWQTSHVQALFHVQSSNACLISTWQTSQPHIYLFIFFFQILKSILKYMSIFKFWNLLPIVKSMAVSHFLKIDVQWRPVCLSSNFNPNSKPNQ